MILVISYVVPDMPKSVSVALLKQKYENRRLKIETALQNVDKHWVPVGISGERNQNHPIFQSFMLNIYSFWHFIWIILSFCSFDCHQSEHGLNIAKQVPDQWFLDWTQAIPPTQALQWIQVKDWLTIETTIVCFAQILLCSCYLSICFAINFI